MTQLTIRGVDERLHDALREEAARRNTSINRTVLSFLRQALGLNGEGGPPYHDLDKYAGRWSEEDYQEFQAFLAEHDKTDEELWR